MCVQLCIYACAVYLGVCVWVYMWWVKSMMVLFEEHCIIMQQITENVDAYA